MTITLFGGMDPSLYDEVKSKEAHGNAVGVAENTLCTYWQDHDHKSGSITEIKELENLPSGGSGMQLRWQTNELLDGFRPTRIIRICCHD